MGPTKSSAAALYDILHEQIALPKSKATKNVTVPLDIFIKARQLISTLVQQPSNDITELCARVGTLIEQLKPTTNAPTYATVTAKPGKTSAHIPKQPPPLKPPKSKLDIVLWQSDRKHPAFTSDTTDDIRRHFNAVLQRLNICSPGSKAGITARAVVKLRGGSIKLIMRSEEDREEALRHKDTWVSQLSPKLQPAYPSYKVIIHGVPTTYNPEEPALIDRIEDENPFMADFDTMWVSRRPHGTVAATKTHSSVVLDCSDAETANNAITNQIVLDGHLLRTEMYRPPIIQCFNCHRFGHLARQCRRDPVCGQCAGSHLTRNCRCPSSPTCADLTQCHHLTHKCALCLGAHPATAPECPTRRDIMLRRSAVLQTRGPLFPDMPENPE